MDSSFLNRKFIQNSKDECLKLNYVKIRKDFQLRTTKKLNNKLGNSSNRS